MLTEEDIENILFDAPFSISYRYYALKNEIEIHHNKTHVATIDNGNTYKWVSSAMVDEAQNDFGVFHQALTNHLNGVVSVKVVEYTPEKGWGFE